MRNGGLRRQPYLILFYKNILFPFLLNIIPIERRFEVFACNTNKLLDILREL